MTIKRFGIEGRRPGGGCSAGWMIVRDRAYFFFLNGGRRGPPDATQAA